MLKEVTEVGFAYVCTIIGGKAEERHGGNETGLSMLTWMISLMCFYGKDHCHS